MRQAPQPKLYKSKSLFKKSAACKKNKDFSKKLDYAKSFAIPGMLNTNVAEFGLWNNGSTGNHVSEVLFLRDGV